MGTVTRTIVPASKRFPIQQASGARTNFHRSDPEPTATFDVFGGNAHRFTRRCLLDQVNERLRITRGLREAIYDALSRAGVSIPFSQRDVHLYLEPNAIGADSSTNGQDNGRSEKTQSSSQLWLGDKETKTMSTREFIALACFLNSVVIPTQCVDGQSPVAPDARLAIASEVAFTEGPAWHPSGNVYFSDITNNRIMRVDPAGQTHVYRTPSGRSNGLMFDRQGRMICCEGGGPEGNRRVVRLELDGTVTVLADRYDGKRLNSPNDVAIDARGRVYFSDPRYGDDSDVEQRENDGQLIEGVYRIDDDGQVLRIIAHEVHRPNGLAISPDQKFLYVADNVNTGPHAVGGHRKLWRFDLKNDGTVDADRRRLLFDWGTDRGPDGMAIDQHGTIYVTAGLNFAKRPTESIERYKAGVYIFTSGGELLDFIAIPMDIVTNCAFGDEDLKTLYITAGHVLWKIRTQVPGHIIFGR